MIANVLMNRVGETAKKIINEAKDPRELMKILYFRLYEGGGDSIEATVDKLVITTIFECFVNVALPPELKVEDFRAKLLPEIDKCVAETASRASEKEKQLMALFMGMRGSRN